MTSKEHIRNTLIATSASIPIAGGTLSVILDKYLPSELQRRKDNIIDSLTEDLENLKSEIDLIKLESPEYLTVFLKVLKRAVDEHHQEKIIAFRNILLNEAIAPSSEFDEITFYIRMVEDLTVDQIRILNLIYKNKLNGSCSTKGNINIYKDLEKIWPEIDKNYLLACVTELISSAKKDLKVKDNKGHTLTDFGYRFVNHIFSPINYDTRIKDDKK
jgi:hypothetical protein